MASSTSFQGQFPSFCKLCEIETKLPWKCIDCDLLMCDRCRERIHPSLRNAGNHEVINIKDIGVSTRGVGFKNIPCKEHDEQICVMFCKSCDQLVCRQCVSQLHKDHGLMEIDEGYQIKVESLKDKRNKMKEKTEKNIKSKLKDIKKAENTTYMEMKKKIRAQNISLKKDIDRYSENLLKELDHKWETLLHLIEEEREKVISLEKNKIDRNIDVIIKSEAFDKFFEMSNQLETSLEKDPFKFYYNSMPNFVPGVISPYNVGLLQDTPTNLPFQVIKDYTTDISNVFDISACVDCLWINNNKVVQKVQLVNNRVKVISNFDINIICAAVTPSNDLLFVPRGKSALKLISSGSDKITTTRYRVDPLTLSCLHVMSDGKVVVGAVNNGDMFPPTGRRVVISMDEKGNHETVYEYDRSNKPLFTLPCRIASTNNGNIFVIDCLSDEYRARVVVLGMDGDIINIYTGHRYINTKNKVFKPVSIATSLSDNVILSDVSTHTLHILNSDGHLLTYFDTGKFEIDFQYSIAISPTGKLYIGCTRPRGSADRAKLYEVKLNI